MIGHYNPDYFFNANSEISLVFNMISKPQIRKKETLNCFPIISISSFIYLIKI